MATEPSAALDARRLEAHLRERVRGEVRFDAASRALYAADASDAAAEAGAAAARKPSASLPAWKVQ